MAARKLAQKAGGLLKGLRSKHRLRHDAKGREQTGGQEVAALAEPDHIESLPDETSPPPHATTAASATTLGKRHRYSTRSMSQNTITIHEDVPEVTTRPRRTNKMSGSIPQIDFFDQDSDSTESDEEVDETVLDDMHKLEENFAGISQRYRLVGRIGEGMLEPR